MDQTKESFLFGNDRGSINTHYLIVIGAVIAMCSVASQLQLKWSVYLGVTLLFTLVFHHAFKAIWSFRLTWLLGFLTLIIFLMEGAPL